MIRPFIPTSPSFSCLQLLSILDEKIGEKTAKQFKNGLVLWDIPWIQSLLLEKLRAKTDFGFVPDLMATVGCLSGFKSSNANKQRHGTYFSVCGGLGAASYGK